MAAICEHIGPNPIHGVRRKMIGQKEVPYAHVQELIFMRSKGPADFRPLRKHHGGNTRSERKTNSRKAQRVTKRPSTDSGEDDDKAELASQSTVVDDQVPPAIPNSTLLEHIATSRFFEQYLSPTRTCFRLDLDFTLTVIENASMRSILSEAIISLGILALPRKSKASCMAARMRYARALKLTNQALQNDAESKSDEVLMAVILLSCFETTPDDEHSVASWTAHLEGARMLLRIRGCQLLQRHTTFRMFSFIRMQILVNCLMSMQPVPKDLLDISETLIKSQDEEERAASQIVLLFSRLCNLFASSRDAIHIHRYNLLAEAIALDKELVDWTNHLPESYEYSTEPSATSYAGYCEVYESVFSAEVWNMYRSTRLGVNGIIIEQTMMLGMAQAQQSLPADSSGPPSMQEPPPACDLSIRFAVLESLRNDICASIPYMLDRTGQNENRKMADIPSCKRTPAMHYILFILRTPGITKEMSMWAQALVDELKGEKEAESGSVWNNSTLRFFKE